AAAADQAKRHPPDKANGTTRKTTSGSTAGKGDSDGELDGEGGAVQPPMWDMKTFDGYLMPLEVPDCSAEGDADIFWDHPGRAFGKVCEDATELPRMDLPKVPGEIVGGNGQMNLSAEDIPGQKLSAEEEAEFKSLIGSLQTAMAMEDYEGCELCILVIRDAMTTFNKKRKKITKQLTKAATSKGLGKKVLMKIPLRDSKPMTLASQKAGIGNQEGVNQKAPIGNQEGQGGNARPGEYNTLEELKVKHAAIAKKEAQKAKKMIVSCPECGTGFGASKGHWQHKKDRKQGRNSTRSLDRSGDSPDSGGGESKKRRSKGRKSLGGGRKSVGGGTHQKNHRNPDSSESGLSDSEGSSSDSGSDPGNSSGFGSDSYSEDSSDVGSAAGPGADSDSMRRGSIPVVDMDPAGACKSADDDAHLSPLPGDNDPLSPGSRAALDYSSSGNFLNPFGAAA
ncbi:unnamed protein product, partial [Polarella glacialis]